MSEHEIVLSASLSDNTSKTLIYPLQYNLSKCLPMTNKPHCVKCDV